MPAQSKSPIPKPWDKVDPAPLPDVESSWLDIVWTYADMAAKTEVTADALSMQHAAALEGLYQSMTWVEEWNAANPPKPDAIGRPVEPQSRNRFTQWLNWRSSRAEHASLAAAQVYRLLGARSTATYLSRRAKELPWTERTLRPLGWYVKSGMSDRLAEVSDAVAQAVADGALFGPSLVARVVREHKATLGQRTIDRGKAVARTRPIRKDAEDDFLRLFKQSGPDEAKDFIRWAVAQLKVRAVSSEATA